MTVIRVEHLSKQYRLGLIGGGTLRADIERWWAMKRGKEDPLSKIGESEEKARLGERFWALRDVSFEVKQGEVLGIIGRNGAGKSTLLKILSRVTSPTEGVVKVKGRIGSLLEVGTGFHGELTGRENTYLNGAILGMTRREVTRKLDEIIAFAEMDKFIDTPVKRYSSGMYVRLAFAVAAHLDPEILIVDEVLAVGDAVFQKKCLGKMGDVAGEGRTVLFVSHNMAAVAQLCSRSALLHHGVLRCVGRTPDTIEAYYTVSESRRREEHRHFSERDFQDPGGRPMWIRAIRVVDQQGHTLLSDVPISGEFEVVLEYVVKEPVAGAYVTCGFIEQGGGEVWWRYDGDSAHYGSRQPGTYRAKLRVPAGFLRDGVYGVRPSIVDITRPRDQVIDTHGVALHVRVADHTSLLSRRGIRWPSVVRFEPGWSTEHVVE